MFWGVTILGGRRYTQTVERSYHISKAALEVSIDSKDLNKKRVQLMLEQNKSHFLLCNLDSGKNIQVDLDLIFTEGEEVTFYLNGQGTVHLTGYVLDFDDVDDYDDLDEESEEESEDEEVTNENEKRILKGGYPSDSKKSKVDSVNGLDDGEDEDLLGSLDPGSDSDEDDEEEDEDEDEEDEEDVPILQKAKPAQKQVNGQVPKLQQQQQKLTPAKGQQNQKNVGSAGKQNNQGGQQNKFGQKGQNSPQGQKPNQNQKGGNQQKGQANQNKQQLNNNKAKGPFTPDQKGERKSLPGGLQIDELHEGHGPEAKKGKFVHVRYVGRLANNKEFDRSSNKPFSFRLGAGEVIKGWDLGLQGMKVGGKRKIVVPPNLGYGSRSAGPIPPNSQLHFEVELVSVS